MMILPLIRIFAKHAINRISMHHGSAVIIHIYNKQGTDRDKYKDSLPHGKLITDTCEYLMGA